jgi:hypothetical protein
MKNNSSKIPRRKFLRYSSLATASSLLGQLPCVAQTAEQALGAEDSKAATLDPNAPQIRVLLHEADGKPLEHDRRITLHARDLENMIRCHKRLQQRKVARELVWRKSRFNSARV